MNLYAVIMAGGRGERFWPMGRRKAPKQLLSLTGEQTMLEETVLRLFPLIPPERVIVITNVEFVDQVRSLLPIPPENVAGEPVGRNTAPCVALAAALIRKRDMSPDATMILLPADHVIRPAKVFQNILTKCTEQAQGGALVTIGITPTFAATGYGYIHCGDMVEEHFYKVLEFKEKPDYTTAEQFFIDGSYKWNSGMFVWRVDTICQEFQKHCPELAVFIDSLLDAPDFITFLNAEFAKCPKISIDYAVMEKAENVVVGAADFYWNDIGSWSSLRSLLPLDDQGNVRRGETLAIDTINSVLISDAETMIGVIGMRDVAIIKSGNGILVCRLSEEQRVRELVQCLAQQEESQKFI